MIPGVGACPLLPLRPPVKTPASDGKKWSLSRHAPVADASPIIGLAKIGRLQILDGLAHEVLIPREVWNEIVAGGGARPEVESIERRFLDSVRDPDEASVAGFRREIDAGEAAALALATANPGCLLLIDDAAGRQVAEAHQLRCIGTAGLLLRAKRAGLTDSLTRDLEALQQQEPFFFGWT